MGLDYACTVGLVEHATGVLLQQAIRGSTSRGIVTLTGASHSLANSEPRSGRDAGALPNLEQCGSKFLEHRSFEEVTLVVESIVGRGSGWRGKVARSRVT